MPGHRGRTSTSESTWPPPAAGSATPVTLQAGSNNALTVHVLRHRCSNTCGGRPIFVVRRKYTPFWASCSERGHPGRRTKLGFETACGGSSIAGIVPSTRTSAPLGLTAYRHGWPGARYPPAPVSILGRNLVILQSWPRSGRPRATAPGTCCTMRVPAESLADTSVAAEQRGEPTLAFSTTPTASATAYPDTPCSIRSGAWRRLVRTPGRRG